MPAIANCPVPFFSVALFAYIGIPSTFAHRRIIFQESAAPRYFGREKNDKNDVEKGDRATPNLRMKGRLSGRKRHDKSLFYAGVSVVRAATTILIGAGIDKPLPESNDLIRRGKVYARPPIDMPRYGILSVPPASKRNQPRQKSEFDLKVLDSRYCKLRRGQRHSFFPKNSPLQHRG